MTNGVPAMLLRRRVRRDRLRNRGQSAVEFAVALPILLLIVALGLDLGRAFLGLVTLNNVVRVAANFASENPDAWNTTNPDAAAQAEYARLVASDAAGIDCLLPSPVPAPSFPNGPNGPNDIGTPVHVSITCQFGFITPVGWLMNFVDVPNSIGDRIPVTASAAFPIRQGVIAGIPVAPVLPTPTPSPTPDPDATPTPTPGATPTPTPMCVVPDMTKGTTDKAQGAWNGAGFTTQVIFNPLNPPAGTSVQTQSPRKDTSATCGGTTVTLTWNPRR